MAPTLTTGVPFRMREKGRGFDRQHDQRQRLSLEQLQAKSRCHAGRQVGHWSRNCPLKGRQRETSRPPTTVNQSSGHRPTAAMFFVEPPATSSGFLSMSADSPTREQYTSESLQDMSSHTVRSYLRFSSPSQPPSPIETWELLSYNFATATETPGRALVDTAAQHGLIGQETLAKLDQHLATKFGMRVQHMNEDGGTVRGVCGSEERTPIAYVPNWDRRLFRTSSCSDCSWCSAMFASCIFADRHGQCYRHGRLEHVPHNLARHAADA